jgi:hypothetical protein
MPDTTPSTEAGAVQRYRKKPVVIEALQWTGSNAEQMTAFAGPHFALVSPQDRAEDPERTAEVWDKLHSTWIGMHDGQWLIRGIRGEFYPHDESAFPEVYEPVTDGAAPLALDVSALVLAEPTDTEATEVTEVAEERQS